MTIYSTDTDRVVTITAVDANAEQRVIASFPKILEGPESRIAEQAKAFRIASESFAAVAAGIAERFSPPAAKAEMRTAAAKTLSGPAQAFLSAGRADARANLASFQRSMSLPAADAATAMLRHEYRAIFRGLPVGDKAAWIERACTDHLAALIEAGRVGFDGIPDEIWSRAEQRYITLNHIRLTGIAADHEQQPSLNHPFAIGVDHDAVILAAEKAAMHHEQRNEIIEIAEHTFRGITNVVALTCDMPLSDAFDLLTGRAE